MLINKSKHYALTKEPKRRPDGRLQHLVVLGIDIATGKKKTKMAYGYTLPELNSEIEELLNKYAGLNYSEMNFEAFLKYYIKYRKSLLTSDDGLSTLEGYEGQFKRYVNPVIGKVPLLDLTPPLITEVFSSMVFKKKGRPGGRTKQNVFVILKTALNFAVKQHLIKVNPMNELDKPIHVPKKRGVLDMADFQKMIKLAEKDEPQNARLLEFALFSGCRRGEIVSLRFGRIDYKNSTVAILTAAKRTKEKGVIIGHPKSAYGVRTLLMPPNCMAILREQELYTKKKCFKLGIPFTQEIPVFNNTAAQQLKLDIPTNMFADYRGALGLSDSVTFHSLRHTLATYMAENDINPKKIQVRLGHASAAFTMQVYTAKTIKMQESIIDTIDKII